MSRITDFPIPSRWQIDAYQASSTHRSPYISAFLHIPDSTHYTEYSIEFRAMHLPRGTYCCLGCYPLDFGPLTPIRGQGDWADSYAGFQHIADGRTTSIMSVWDREFQFSGGKRLHSAHRLYPAEVIDGGRFWGEGEGERSSAPYQWEANHWYRMHLKLVPGCSTTYLEQHVTDLESGRSQLLCRYDLGLPNGTFRGRMAVFLENYLIGTSGEVRSMQIRNARYKPVAMGTWLKISAATVSSWTGLPHFNGSYDFGSDAEGLWMITSGVGGDWYTDGRGKRSTDLPLP